MECWNTETSSFNDCDSILPLFHDSPQSKLPLFLFSKLFAFGHANFRFSAGLRNFRLIGLRSNIQAYRFHVWSYLNLLVQGGGSYMSKVRTVSRFTLFFLAMAVATTTFAAEKVAPSGKVSIESTSIAAGIGVSWGDG